jgi:DNA-binding MarR family transcriptional regulator
MLESLSEEGMDKDKTALIEEVCELEHQLMLAMQQTNAEAWKDLGVPMAQLKSLYFIIHKGNINFKSLARDLGVTPANMTAIIERLVEQGLVSRLQNPEDRRVILLQATDKGRELLTGLMESGRKQLAEILAYISDEELSSLAQSLSVLIRAVQEYNRGDHLFRSERLNRV